MRPFDPNRYGNPLAARKTSRNSDKDDSRPIREDEAKMSADRVPPQAQKPMSPSFSHVHNGSLHSHLQSRGPEQPKINTINTEDTTLYKPAQPQPIPAIGAIEGSLRLLPTALTNGVQNVDSISTTAQQDQKQDHSTGHSEVPIKYSSSVIVNKHEQKPSARSTNPEMKPHVIAQQMLADARKERLKHITFRNRSKDQNTTTSLHDLGLARKAAELARYLSPECPEPRIPQVINDSKPLGSAKALSAQSEVAFLPKLEHTDEDHSCPGTYRSRGSWQGEDAKVTEIASEHHLSTRPNTGSPIEGAISAAPRTLPPVSELHNSCWASKVEMVPQAATPLPSDASIASGDSLMPLANGRPFMKEREMVAETPLTGYDGNWQPPPVDWEERPRFDNRNPIFKDTFDHWMNDTLKLAMCHTTGKRLKVLRNDIIQREGLRPDGIGMVERDTVINAHNAAQYGYTDVQDATQYADVVKPTDFVDWGKLDPGLPENDAHKHESTEDLVRIWRKSVASRRAIQKSRLESRMANKARKQVYRSDIVLVSPDINIYVRPAVNADVRQMTEIYNEYVKISCRTAELNPISRGEMRERLFDAESSTLPFLVAALRNSRSRMIPPYRTKSRRSHDVNNLQETGDDAGAVTDGIERVVGWVSAQDFTAADFVERISVEVELYVKPEFRQKGVGRCLMDQVLVSLDRGYIKQGNYLFTCAEELRHIYSSGGHRDVHKILLVVRKYKTPARGCGPLMPQDGGVEKAGIVHDAEDDFDTWLQNWLQRCGFKLEAMLSGIGTKHKRYLDIAYMSRETMWQPTEGNIPEPLLRA